MMRMGIVVMMMVGGGRGRDEEERYASEEEEDNDEDTGRYQFAQHYLSSCLKYDSRGRKLQ